MLLFSYRKNKKQEEVALKNFEDLFDYIVHEIDGNSSEGIVYYYDQEVDRIFNDHLSPVVAWGHKNWEEFLDNEEDEERLEYAQRVFDDFGSNFRDTAFATEDFFQKVYQLEVSSNGLSWRVSPFLSKSEFYRNQHNELRAFLTKFAETDWYNEHEIDTATGFYKLYLACVYSGNAFEASSWSSDFTVENIAEELYDDTVQKLFTLGVS